MAFTSLEIVPAAYAPATQTTLYTSPAITITRIDKLTVTNTDTVAHTISINLVPNAGTASAANLTTDAYSIAAGQTWNSPNEYGHYLNAGDLISVVASVASKLVIAIGGTQMT